MATLEVTGLAWPRGQEARHIDWSELRGYDICYRSAEAFTYEHEDHTYTLIGSDGDVVGAVVDGETLAAWALADRLSAEVDEGAETAEYAALDATLAALRSAREQGADMFGAEGPMMNYFYPVTNHDDIAEMAAHIADLPLCVVELEDTGEIGLALTGGGMDLSWEIAEAFIRLGYRPPLSIDLPAMVGRGESETDQAIVLAVVETKQAHARNLMGAADRLIALYLPDYTD